MELFDNVVSDYTTQLYQPIKFDGEWEVGIAKVIYRNSIKSTLGFLQIRFKEHEYKFDLTCYDGDLVSTIINEFNDHISEIIDKFPGETPLKISLKSEPNEYKTIKIEILNEDVKLQIGGYLNDLLHVPETSLWYSKKKPFESKFKDIKVNTNVSMFIYTDIIKDQIVGDTKAKLLDTLSIKGGRDEVVTIDVENPNYVDVGKSEVNSINISRRDSTGNLIHFTKFVRFIIKLHFRPKNA
jgi:hypothetical protein